MEGSAVHGPLVEMSFSYFASSVKLSFNSTDLLRRVRIHHAIHFCLGMLTLKSDDHIVEVGISARLIQVLIAANKNGIRTSPPPPVITCVMPFISKRS